MKLWTLEEFREAERLFDQILLLTPEAEIRAAIQRYLNSPESVAVYEDLRRSLPEEIQAVLGELGSDEMREAEEISLDMETNRACHDLAVYWIKILLLAWNSHGGKDRGIQLLDSETLLPVLPELPSEQYQEMLEKTLKKVVGSIAIEGADLMPLLKKFAENIKEKLVAEKTIGLSREINLVLTDGGEYQLIPRTTTP